MKQNDGLAASLAHHVQPERMVDLPAMFFVAHGRAWILPKRRGERGNPQRADGAMGPPSGLTR
jgi:hypothetical protein